MASRKSGRGGWLFTGLGFGVAAGVALGTLLISPAMEAAPGTGIASGEQDSGSTPADGSTDDAQRADIDAAQASASDAVVSELAPAAVQGVLTDRPVLVIRTFDADDADVTAVRDLLAEAGAAPAGEITLTEKFFSQDAADELKSLVATTLPAGAQLSEDNMAPGVHAGESLGAALMYDEAKAQPLASVEDRALVLQTLREQGFIDYQDGTILPGHGIVMITGDSDGAGESTFAAPMVADVAAALDSRGGSVVLAGRIHSAAEHGAIGRLRASEEQAAAVSTVDSVDRAWGQVATVLAMREQIDGGSGAYGAAASAQAPAPARPSEQAAPAEAAAEAPADTAAE